MSGETRRMILSKGLRLKAVQMHNFELACLIMFKPSELVCLTTINSKRHFSAILFSIQPWRTKSVSKVGKRTGWEDMYICARTHARYTYAHTFQHVHTRTRARACSNEMVQNVQTRACAHAHTHARTRTHARATYQTTLAHTHTHTHSS